MDLFTIERTKGGSIAWTKEQVAYIIDEYVNNNITLKELGRRFGVSYGSIRNLLNRHNIKSRGNKQGYPRNEFYFFKIDTIEKAYWLGFLYADGCVHSNNNEISIQIIDKEHLLKFQKAIQAPNHKIQNIIDKRFEKAKPLFQISIKDKQLHQDLIKWGCIPQKSLRLKDFPNIPYHFIPHFLRGYFDGDGSLHFLQGTNNFRISFLGTPEFLTNIKNYFNLNMSIAKGTGEAYILQIAGRKQLIRILEILYLDSHEEIRLNRKYNKYQEFLLWAHRF